MGGMAFVVLHFFFARTSIVLWPQMRELHSDELIQIAEGSNLKDTALPMLTSGVMRSETIEGDGVFSSTGTKKKEQEARGVIRVYNGYSTSSQTFIAQTRFVSENGKLFRAIEKIKIPGARREGGKLIAGAVDVPVEAQEPGEAYNIGPSNFSLPGLVGTAMYTSIYGKSAESMKGGAVESISIVSADDIERAKQTLLLDLKEKALAKFRGALTDGFMLVPEALSAEFVSFSSVAKEGEEFEHFTSNAKVQVTTMFFPKRELESLVEKALNDQLEKGEYLKKDTMQYSASVENFDVLQKLLTVRVNGSVQGYWELDTEEIRSQVQGLNALQMSTLLEQYPHIAQSDLSFWPFWERRASKDLLTIEIKLNIEPLQKKD